MTRLRADPVYRIKNYYTPIPEAGCWLWDLAWDGQGYGVIDIYGRQHGAHRVSYMVHKGDPGEGLVCHKCDTPSCINPDHLFLGSPLDNMQDKVKKGRGKGPPKKSHCKRGHPLQHPNIYTYTDSGRTIRVCKTCSSEASKRSAQRKKEGVNEKRRPRT